MKSLGKWQIISFGSRIAAMSIGLIQSFVILRILTVSEWGIIRIALSLGSALGIYQHLGLAGASTREISVAKSDKEIFKIFVTSVLIRYLISVPLAIGLFLSAGVLAQKYGAPEIESLIRIYALVMIAQGVQSILNSVISGTQRFKRLFIYQTGVALISVVLYVPLVFLYRINGYFYALLLFNILASILLAVIAFAPLKDWFELPSKREFVNFFKELFSISMALFLVKVLYTNWENIGPNLLGLSVTAEAVGIFGFAALYAKKILAISDSVTDVNLAIFSEKYGKEPSSFVETFRANFNKIFVLVLFLAYSAVFWSSELTHVVVGLDKYGRAIPLIMPIMFAFVFYSFLDIVKSSVFVPAKMGREMIAAYGVMLAVTIAAYFAAKAYFAANKYVEPLLVMSVAMCLGTFLALLFTIGVTKKKIGSWLFSHEHYLIIAQSVVIAFAWHLENLVLKIGTYTALTIFYVWAVKVSNLVDLKEIWQKITTKLAKLTS